MRNTKAEKTCIFFRLRSLSIYKIGVAEIRGVSRKKAGPRRRSVLDRPIKNGENVLRGPCIAGNRGQGGGRNRGNHTGGKPDSGAIDPLRDAEAEGRSDAECGSPKRHGAPSGGPHSDFASPKSGQWESAPHSSPRQESAEDSPRWKRVGGSNAEAGDRCHPDGGWPRRKEVRAPAAKRPGPQRDGRHRTGLHARHGSKPADNRCDSRHIDSPQPAKRPGPRARHEPRSATDDTPSRMAGAGRAGKKEGERIGS